MPQFQIGSSRAPEDDEEDDEAGTRERRQSLRKKRHYKKDSRFVLDLYTLTFDEDETVDEIAPAASKKCMSVSMSMPPGAALATGKPISPPASLNLSSASDLSWTKDLETNLHKILARKFLHSEEVSFKKAKLLTKAYYRLLRKRTHPQIEFAPFQETSSSHSRPLIIDERLSWSALVAADTKELSRMVAGLTNTAKALNDYLMELLQERDGLQSQQDDMLEHISELTDTLLE